MLETIVGVATPPGIGALAVLRLSGGQALAAASGFLAEASRLEPRRAVKTRAQRGEETLDEVVAVFFPALSSPTGEDLVEITCHGSPYIVERLLTAALGSGARQACPGEFTQRAFLNGKMDLAQAESVCDLIASRTAEAHKSALSQLAGGLSKEISRLREPLLELLVGIEANLDHPEEDLPGLSGLEFCARANAAANPMTALAGTFERGRLIRDGAKIAIVGRPNAGKSSLLNALLGRDRAIVCPEPGTTRDTLEESADIRGLSTVLIDTAGLRAEASDPAELMGMQRTEKAIEDSDIAVLVMDGSRDFSVDDRRVQERILRDAAEQGRRVVSVLNKADLPVCASGFPVDSIRVSSVSKQGLGELVEKIGGVLSDKKHSDPIVVTSVRHHQALLRAAGEISAAAQAASDHPGAWEDRAARHLREALSALDEITGSAAGDEVLAAIFSKFCVGK